MARGVLDRHLAQRGLPVTPAKWDPATPLLGSLDGEAGITSKRLWAIVKRFFATAADVLRDANPALAEKLRRATPHWMRHYLPFLTMSRDSERVVRHRGNSVFVPRRARPITRHSQAATVR